MFPIDGQNILNIYLAQTTAATSDLKMYNIRFDFDLWVQGEI